MLSETRPTKVGKWSEAALRVLRERYLTRKGGEVTETPEEMCWRVAISIAEGEARYGRSPAAVGACAPRNAAPVNTSMASAPIQPTAAAYPWFHCPSWKPRSHMYTVHV